MIVAETSYELTDPTIDSQITSPTDYRINKQMQMMKFNGERWELFGPIIEDSGPPG